MIVTRFAPSPTGHLHIGGARSALFNYHFAKKNKGVFLLRIEDTDKSRNTKAALESIINGLNWLNIKSDHKPVFQSQNIDRHRKMAQHLLDEGLAYHCYEKKVTVDNKVQIQRTEQPSIKLKIPKGKTVVKDTVHGDIEFDNQDIGDIVLLRSTQDPTYMLSVVVDDIDMKITNVIRGDDHISNTPKQILIYQALGASIPSFSHMPLIHGMDGKKLSKRHNAVSVEEYEKMGYLPEAVCNYLMLLGWNPKSEEEIFSELELTNKFRLEDINKSSAKFDSDRLNYINLQHIKEMKDEILIEKLKPMIFSNLANCKYKTYSNSQNNISDNIKVDIEEDDRNRILKSLPECKKNNNLINIANTCCLFLDNYPFKIEIEAKDIIINNKEVANELVLLLDNFKKTDEEFEGHLKEFMSNKGYKFGKIGPLLRAMLVGKTSSVSLIKIVNIIGIKETKRRAKNTFQSIFSITQ